MNGMRIIGDMFQSIFAIFGAWYIYLYYKGRLNYKGLEEKVRRENVEKNEGFFLITSALLFFFGAILFIISLLRLFGGI